MKQQFKMKQLDTPSTDTKVLFSCLKGVYKGNKFIRIEVKNHITDERITVFNLSESNLRELLNEYLTTNF